MTTENDARKLRMSIARVAQMLDLPPYTHIPGHPVDWSIDALTAAVQEPRGWNALLAHIVNVIQQREQRWQSKLNSIKLLIDEM